MEDKNPKLDDDSDIIIIENIPETISVVSTPKKKKQKVKKQKVKKPPRRTVKLGFDHGTVENLVITQRTQKRAKFRCIININTVCEQKSDSIIRYSKNKWKKEAYYDRIVPICSRNKCFSDDNMNNICKLRCCRADWSKENTAIISTEKTDGMLSPVSSIPLTEALGNISYEEVSIGSLSSSEDELDRLIKRTKEREKLFHPLNVFSAPVMSTPKHDLASTSELSLHSLATLVLTPLKTEAYSSTKTNYIQDSSTLSPDFIKIENQYSPVQSLYSPTHPTVTPHKYTMELERDGRVISPYSQASRRLKFEIDDENSNRVLEFVKEERIDVNDAIKTEEIAVKSEKNS